MMLLAFPDYLSQAEALATQLTVPLAEVYVHHFPDSESFIELPSSLSPHVVICRSLNQPNDKLIELLLCAATAKKLGARRLTLLAPYLCYMRQDFANRPGVAVSQRIIGRLLADLFDDVITVDPHLHRISLLSEAIPCKKAVSLSASTAIAEFLKRRFQEALLFGPDAESRQWVAGIADKTGFHYAVAEKKRKGDKQVELMLPECDYRNRPIIIIDDMASTGRTLSQAAKLLRSKGGEDIYAVVTHALFCGDAEAQIAKAGIIDIWSTDSISHLTSAIKLSTILATALAALT
ncbi:MAG: ribose-phosphate diphosphokinase [Gammaproteobacteria bacterium]